MEIRLHRKYLKKGYSIGILYINGERICETLEDTDRGLAVWRTLEDNQSRKIKGETAIPVGVYEVLWTYSPRFKKNLPLLKNVPAYDGVRIHAGNKAKDTEGCILCGRNTEVGTVTNSRYWTDIVNSRIEKAIKNKEQVFIKIEW